MKTRIAMICLMAIALVGCDADGTSAAGRYATTLNSTAGYLNAKDVGRGYVMYQIDNGAVTCREHVRRSELTCWLNAHGG
jgi:hypothetical protein